MRCSVTGGEFPQQQQQHSQDMFCFCWYAVPGLEAVVVAASAADVAAATAYIDAAAAAAAAATVLAAAAAAVVCRLCPARNRSVSTFSCVLCFVLAAADDVSPAQRCSFERRRHSR